jgi:hypothetical protein
MRRLSRLFSQNPTAGATLLLVCLVPFLVHALNERKTPLTTIPDKQSAKLTRLSEAVSVRVEKPGNPAINLSDGRDLLTSYVGPEDLRIALEQNLAEPLSLASADSCGSESFWETRSKSPKE